VNIPVERLSMAGDAKLITFGKFYIPVAVSDGVQGKLQVRIVHR
jgi:hypothetical protein